MRWAGSSRGSPPEQQSESGFESTTSTKLTLKKLEFGLRMLNPRFSVETTPTRFLDPEIDSDRMRVFADSELTFKNKIHTEQNF